MAVTQTLFMSPENNPLKPMLDKGSMEDVSVFVKHQVLGACWHKGHIKKKRRGEGGGGKTQYQQRILSMKKRAFFNYVVMYVPMGVTCMRTIGVLMIRNISDPVDFFLNPRTCYRRKQISKNL